MKNILSIISLVTEHIGIHEGRKTTEISAFIKVKEESVQEMLNNIEEMGGEWRVAYNVDGDIGIRVKFKTSDSENDYIKAAKLVNRHWFETRFQTNREALLKYCEDIIASK